MTTLLTARQVSKAYGTTTLFEHLSLTIDEGQRLGVIGPNGAGKTSLLRVLGRLEPPDEGEVTWRKELRVALVEQQADLDLALSVTEVVAAAAARADRKNALTDEHDRAVKVASLIDRLGFDRPHQLTGELSGGWIKRLALAAALVTEPELLLLDEPTNHLDLEGIEWLERHLVGSRCALIVISHDRAFLQAVAQRVMEVDRRLPGGTLVVDGPYSEFLEKRAGLIEAEAKREQSLRSRVERELEWLRQGPKARTTKARGRIDSARELVEELDELHSRGQSSGVAKDAVEFASTGRKSKRLLVARGLSRSIDGRLLFRDLDLLLRPGLRLGLVGPNGCGKTTLLRTLAGELEPDSGEIHTAPHLQVVSFDQRREQLDLRLTLRRTLAPDGDMVIFQGRQIHVVGWARRFGFRADQLDLPLSELSGGEQAKTLIARLLLRPADLLLLDEPTNDLDIPTLEVLEESLVEFPGALVIVTHDRYLLDRVSTVVLGLAQGQATIYADYHQWTEARAAAREQSKKKSGVKSRRGRQRPARSKGLSYHDQREYAAMEEVILAAEEELEAAAATLVDPKLVSDAAALADAYQAHQRAQAEVDRLYARWAELEAKAAGGDD